MDADGIPLVASFRSGHSRPLGVGIGREFKDDAKDMA